MQKGAVLPASEDRGQSSGLFTRLKTKGIILGKGGALNRFELCLCEGDSRGPGIKHRWEGRPVKRVNFSPAQRGGIWCLS